VRCCHCIHPNQDDPASTAINKKSKRVLNQEKDCLEPPTGLEPSADKEPLADEEPSADKEPSADEEPSADKEPSANEEPLAGAFPRLDLSAAVVVADSVLSPAAGAAGFFSVTTFPLLSPNY